MTMPLLSPCHRESQIQNKTQTGVIPHLWFHLLPKLTVLWSSEERWTGRVINLSCWPFWYINECQGLSKRSTALLTPWPLNFKCPWVLLYTCTPVSVRFCRGVSAGSLSSQLLPLHVGLHPVDNSEDCMSSSTHRAAVPSSSRAGLCGCACYGGFLPQQPVLHTLFFP